MNHTLAADDLILVSSSCGDLKECADQCSNYGLDLAQQCASIHLSVSHRDVFVIHSVLEIIGMSLQWCFLRLVLNTLCEIWWHIAP